MANQIQQALNQVMPLIALEFSNELKIAVPVDTARLRSSIKVFVEGNVLKIFMVDYGKHVEFGTLPHIITPKNKKALKFKSGGKTIFAKRVNHPGTRPNNFIRRTIRRKLPGIITKNIARVL